MGGESILNNRRPCTTTRVAQPPSPDLDMPTPLREGTVFHYFASSFCSFHDTPSAFRCAVLPTLKTGFIIRPFIHPRPAKVLLRHRWDGVLRTEAHELATMLLRYRGLQPHGRIFPSPVVTFRFRAFEQILGAGAIRTSRSLLIPSCWVVLLLG